MIRIGYLVPSERPIKMIDVKKALLTYDRVYLPDPDDRDLIPPQTFSSIVFGMPLAVHQGPIRALGKIPAYDDSFDQLLDELSAPYRQEIIQVVSSFERRDSGTIILGPPQLGNYPLNPEFMFHAYREVVTDQDVLKSAILGDDALNGSSDDLVRSIAEGNFLGDFSIGGGPRPPLLEGNLLRNHLRAELSSIARGRIAATMKSIGYCASKNMVPIFTNNTYNNIASSFLRRATEVIDEVAVEDPYWLNRCKALDVAHDEYLEEAVLDEMPIEDVLRLRTAVWGAQAEKRDGLLEAIASLAREYDGADDFEDEVRTRIQDYRLAATALMKERSRLNFSIKCDLLMAGLTATPSMITGMYSQMQSAIGAGTILMGGCLFATKKFKDYANIVSNLRAAEDEFSDNACFGLHNFYRGAARAVGSDEKL